VPEEEVVEEEQPSRDELSGEFVVEEPESPPPEPPKEPFIVRAYRYLAQRERETARRRRRRRRKKAREEERREEEARGGYKPIEELRFPALVRVGDYVVMLMEAHKVDVPWGTHFIVSARLVDGGWISPPFQIPAKDSKELRQKLEEEVRRYDLMKRVYGDMAVRR